MVATASWPQFAAAALAALAAAAPAEAQRVADDLPLASGSAETCLRERAVREWRIIDDGTILFYMRSGAVYVNALNRLADVVLELPRACIGLSAEELQFARTRIGRVCAGDPIDIELADGEVRPFLPTCRLGVFYRLSASALDELLERNERLAAPAEPSESAEADPD